MTTTQTLREALIFARSCIDHPDNLAVIDAALALPAESEPWGWAILDKHDVAQAIRPRHQNFFGCVQELKAFTTGDVAKLDREWPGLVPHRLITLYTSPQPTQQFGEAAKAWAEGYRAGVSDERTSEANIGIAGFGMRVEPARENPYRYTTQPTQPTEQPCPRCEGSGEVMEMSDSGPDAHEVSVCCGHCHGTGALEDAYKGAVALLNSMTANYYKALPYMVKFQNERPCHVFNVTKTGAHTEWEPTTHAFALPDGKHALYTTPPTTQPEPTLGGMTEPPKAQIKDCMTCNHLMRLPAFSATCRTCNRLADNTRRNWKPR